jgi:hypothetical protein
VIYNPEKAPPVPEWPVLDDSERIAMLEKRGIAARESVFPELTNANLHGIIHTVVENQITWSVSVIVKSRARLRALGLSRHDAIHAIGSVLTEQIFHTIKGRNFSANLTEVYYDRVRRLSAAEWLRSGP